MFCIFTDLSDLPLVAVPRTLLMGKWYPISWNSKILYRHLCLPIFQNTLQNQFSDTNTAPVIFKIYLLSIKAEVTLWIPRIPLGYFGSGCWLWWCCCCFVKYATWDERNQKYYREIQQWSLFIAWDRVQFAVNMELFEKLKPMNDLSVCWPFRGNRISVYEIESWLKP